MTVRSPLPPCRGPLTAHLFSHLHGAPHRLPPLPPADEDVLSGDDLQLALYCCYELHYQGFAGVDDGWEWEPSLLGARRDLEHAFERRLVDEVGPVVEDADVGAGLRAVIGAGSGPSLSGYLRDDGSLEELREFAVHRSAYQLKEADPHTWAIPRLQGGAKAALVEIQADEYGGGVESEMHSTLFASTMDLLGLDSRYGTYLPLLPGPTLATCNLVSLFGLHRRWRGALVGHLAVFEMTSVGPMSRYAAALSRHEVDADAARFYDVHVAIDGHHEVVASKLLAGGLAAAEPELVGDILFGARALMEIEGRFSRHLLASWEAGGTSLRSPLPVVEPADRGPGRWG